MSAWSNGAMLVVLPLCSALFAVGCLSESTDDPTDGQEDMEEAVAVSADAEHTAAAEQACGGGFGRWGGGGFGGPWGFGGGYRPWGGCGFNRGFYGGCGGWGGCF